MHIQQQYMLQQCFAIANSSIAVYSSTVPGIRHMYLRQKRAIATAVLPVYYCGGQRCLPLVSVCVFWHQTEYARHCTHQSPAALDTIPISLVIVPEITDHAHGEPMHICVKKAGATMAHRFVKSGDACSKQAEHKGRPSDV